MCIQRMALRLGLPTIEIESVDGVGICVVVVVGRAPEDRIDGGKATHGGDVGAHAHLNDAAGEDGAALLGAEIAVLAAGAAGARVTELIRLERREKSRNRRVDVCRSDYVAVEVGDLKRGSRGRAVVVDHSGKAPADAANRSLPALRDAVDLDLRPSRTVRAVGVMHDLLRRRSWDRRAIARLRR